MRSTELIARARAGAASMSRRGFLRRLLAFPIALASVGAAAHALVVASRPSPNAVVAPGEIGVELRFNSRIDARRSRVVVREPDGAELIVAVASDPSRAMLTGRVVVARAGRFALRWQVLSVDGHVTRGEIPFVVTNRRS